MPDRSDRRTTCSWPASVFRATLLYMTTRTAIENYMKAIQGGDEAALRDAFHPDATWWLPGDLPVSRTWRGRDAILGEFLVAVMERFVPGSVRFTTRSVIVDGDAAVLEW